MSRPVRFGTAAFRNASYPSNMQCLITCPADSAPLAELLQQVRERYGRTPGLELTKPQAMRAFGVAPSVCAAMFRALVRENFLSRASEGVFVRSTTDSKNEPRRYTSDAVVA